MFYESGSYWNLSSIIPMFSELTHLMFWYHLGRAALPCQDYSGVLPPSPHYARTARGSVLWSCQELAQCPRGAPLAW